MMAKVKDAVIITLSRRTDMGCDCCKVVAPKDYKRCKVANGSYKGFYIAPCGMDFGSRPGTPGSNYTPPKKKRKKRK